MGVYWLAVNHGRKECVKLGKLFNHVESMRLADAADAWEGEPFVVVADEGRHRFEYERIDEAVDDGEYKMRPLDSDTCLVCRRRRDAQPPCTAASGSYPPVVDDGKPVGSHAFRDD